MKLRIVLKWAAMLSLALLFACKSSKKRPSTGNGRQGPAVATPMREDTGAAKEEDALDAALRRRLERINTVVETADSYTGTKHRMGGMSKKGIDCSGLVVVSYKSISLPLPRTTFGQMEAGVPVGIDDLQKGDLVFFTYPGGKKVTHVGIVKEVKGPKEVIFIHTSSSKGVRDDNLFSSYWRSNYLGARRVL